jgi:hypothetical protein
MKVSRDVIRDLWPLVEAGEASPDTQALVEEFLRDDPELAQALRKTPDALLGGARPALPPDNEAKTLTRTKHALLGYNWLQFLAMLFTALAFGRIVSDTSWDVSPRNFIMMAAMAGVFWIAFLARTWWVQARALRSTRR